MTIPLFFWVLSLILTSLPSFVSAADTDTCYRYDGTLAPEPSGFLPCYPGVKGSPCCGVSDFCMSNGLCLNAGGNQFMSVQGCTDPDPTACMNGNICDKTKFVPPDSNDGTAIVWVCDPNTTAEGRIRYCCGKVDCCKGNDVRERALATAVFRPPQAISASASTSSASASAGTGQPTRDGSNVGGGGGGGGNDNSHALAIGLGVGIPMGLALLGGIVFLGLQVRKSVARAGEAKGATVEGGNNSPQQNDRGDEPPFVIPRQEVHADAVRRVSELR